MRRTLLWLPVVALAVGAGFLARGLVPLDPLAQAAAGAAPAGASAPPGRPAEGAVGVAFPTGERIVTLADQPVLRYAKVEVVLELAARGAAPRGDAYRRAQDELAQELSPFLPAIEDAITAAVSRRTAAELTGPDGRDALRRDLLERLQRLPLPRPVQQVYLTQFVIQ